MQLYEFNPQELYTILGMIDEEERGKFIVQSCLKLIKGDTVEWAKKKPKPLSKEAIGEYTPEFEQFWKLYPNKQSKHGAYASWKKIKNVQSILGAVLASVRNQCKSEQWTKDKGKWVPMAQTYINNRRWEDILEVEQPAKERYMTPDGIWKER